MADGASQSESNRNLTSKHHCPSSPRIAYPTLHVLGKFRSSPFSVGFFCEAASYLGCYTLTMAAT